MKYFLEQVGMDDETGEIDMDKISGRMKSSERNKIFQVRDKLIELSKEHGEMIPEEEIMKSLSERMTEMEIEEAVEKLIREGSFFRPRRGFVQKV